MNIHEGWKLVPVEPTTEMVEAAFDALQLSLLDGKIRTHYRAMLDAAPTPPAQQDEALEVLRAVIAASDHYDKSSWTFAGASAADRLANAIERARALLTKRGKA